MILSKDANSFYNEYGWIDGIVKGIHWDNRNMFDLLIDVYSYEGQNNGRDLTIRFKNCRKAMFTMPKAFDRISKDELELHKSNFTFSWYTITHYDVREENGLLEVSIKTIDDDLRWLNVKCEEIWVEEDKGTVHPS